MGFTYSQIKEIPDKHGDDPIITYNDGYDYNGYNVYRNEKTGYTEIRYRIDGHNKIKPFITEDRAIKYIDDKLPCRLLPSNTNCTPKQNTDEYYTEDRDSKYYRKLYESHYNVKIKEGNHIHHIDGDYTNNNPTNLIEVTPEEHGWLHSDKQYSLRKCPREEIIIHLQKWKEDKHYPNGYVHKHPYADDQYYYSKLKVSPILNG
jgi:hypothetical protein